MHTLCYEVLSQSDIRHIKRSYECKLKFKMHTWQTFQGPLQTADIGPRLFLLYWPLPAYLG